MSWRSWRSPQSHGTLALPRRAWSRGLFLVGSLLLALPLASLGVVPAAALAHAAHPAHAAAPRAGKALSPAVDLTLHYRSTLSGLSQPYRMGTDAAGNLYVADPGVEQVLMYNASDTFVRAYGNGTSGTANGDFKGPRGIAVSGNTVFIADNGNDRIQAFNQATGAFITEFGDAVLSFPEGLAISPDGSTLYVVENGNDRISEFDTSGNYLSSFGTLGAGNGEFNGPLGITISAIGALYVTDSGNKRVQRFTLNGTYVTQWGHNSFSDPNGIAVDRAGMVYAVDQGANIVYKFDPNGSLVGSYAAPPTTPFVPGTFVTAAGVAVRSIANAPIAVYVSDVGQSDVQRFDQVLDPQVHTYQSQFGGGGSGTGQFSGTGGVVVDSAGNVYVTDADNNRVEKFDQFGNFVLAFGSAGSDDGQFNGPQGIAISPDGQTLYVVDEFNGRVEEFNPSGTYLGQFGTSGDGQLNHPSAIASDGTDLYVADIFNNRIVVFDTSGTYVSQFGSYGSGSTQFNFPDGIAVDIARQELFIADANNNRVQVYTTGGSYITSLTSAASVTLNYPTGASTDQRGDVYVADSGHNRIVEFDVNLTRTAAFGSTGTGTGQFSNPTDAVVSPTNGQLYVADSNNNRVEVWGSPWPKDDTVGIYRPPTKTFYLRNHNLTGPADISVYMPYAQAGDLPIVGDWNGDGVDTVGLYRPSKARFLLQDANVQQSAPDYTFTLGIAGDTPIAGDWNGDGTTGAGIFRPSNGILYLKNSLSTGVADDNLVLGVPGDVGIAGDWNGDGQDSPGVYRPSNERFYVTNKVTDGVVTSDHSAVLGISGDAPFTGDWIAQGFSGIGVFRPSNGVTYEKNQIFTGPADNNFVYGVAGDYPVAGQWVAPSVPFSAPAPHVSLGTRSSGTRSSGTRSSGTRSSGTRSSGAPSHPASGGTSTPAPGHPAVSGQVPAATPRRTTAR